MESLDKSISFALNYTTRNMRRYATEAMNREKAGITVDQWGVLKLLHEHGGMLNNSQLTERMLKDRPTLTRIVDLLCKKGLVRRTTDKDDRRRMQIRLTAKGNNSIAKVSPLVDRLRKELGKGLTKKEHDELHRILKRLNEKIETLRTSSSS